MPCYHPIRGFKSRTLNESGKRSLTFNPKDGYIDMPMSVACGSCIGCRIERVRQWAVRCVHEASLYENNCYITLTYNDENLPKDKSLHVEDFQRFMKRLRKANGNGIRFFHCGEYGENLSRPHYHALLFNYDFADKIYFKSYRGNKYFISDRLADLWPYGFHWISDLTFDSAAYVAKYCTKKVTGIKSHEHYQTIQEDGEIYEVKPEYVTMSRRPGIGKPWFDKFKSDVYPSDFVVINGKMIKPPRYYDKILENLSNEEYDLLKSHRRIFAKEHADNNTPRRLEDREEIQKYKLKNSKRSYENDT